MIQYENVLYAFDEVIDSNNQKLNETLSISDDVVSESNAIYDIIKEDILSKKHFNDIKNKII